MRHVHNVKVNLPVKNIVIDDEPVQIRSNYIRHTAQTRPVGRAFFANYTA